MKHQYCVYLTIYSGTKLPLFYVGSSSIEKVQNGYNGSVTSKKYKAIYLKEQKENKHLFKTIIIRTCYNRSMALAMEQFIHIKDNVVKSDLFFNMSVANKNGFFGMDVSGKNNPNYGNVGEKNPLFGIPKTKEHNMKNSEAQKGEKGNAYGKTPWNKGLKSNKQPLAKIIKIYDNLNNEMFTTNGDFIKFCIENKLPHDSLGRSYRNNGTPLYISKYSHNINPKYLKFKGWYALIIKP